MKSALIQCERAGKAASLMDVPVLLIIFNKPDTTAKVFQAIARARPTKLFIAADGPRVGKAGEAETCAAARAVVQDIDWPCEVKLKFSDVNLGCGRNPASAITWVFEHVDRAVILEDDCVPHETFFRFCSELLERYLNNPQIMHIAGNNWQMGKRRSRHSYFFSSHNLCNGGWATWRRAWAQYDPLMTEWPMLRESNLLQQIVKHPVVVAHMREMFDQVHAAAGNIGVWDYQWTLLLWARGGLSILPASTLISNIGFGHPNATHTCSAIDSHALLTGSLKMKRMKFPMSHPTDIARLIDADRFIAEKVIVPCLVRPNGFYAIANKAWIEFLQARPSLRTPRSFLNRIYRMFSGSRTSASVRPYRSRRSP